ncbi:MAG: PAS sensor protein [Bacteroidales bacterium]|nr:PAS sensor protein [Bacteroidales bacterium]
MTDFFKGTNLAITVSSKDGEVLYQNDSSIEVNGDVRGKNMLDCHNERSKQIIHHLIDDAASNTYTISKKGKKKLIYQTPWYEDDAKTIVGGLVEFSIVLPEEVPHYERS